MTIQFLVHSDFRLVLYQSRCTEYTVSKGVGLPIRCGLPLSPYKQATVPEHVSTGGGFLILCALGGRGQHQFSHLHLVLEKASR